MSFWNSVVAYFNANNKPIVPDFDQITLKEKLMSPEVSEANDKISGQFFSSLIKKHEASSKQEATDFTWLALSKGDLSEEVFEALLGFWARTLLLDEREIARVQRLMDDVFINKSMYKITFEWRVTFERDILKLVKFIYDYRGYAGTEVFYAFLEAYFVLFCLFECFKDQNIGIRKKGFVSLLEEVLSMSA